MIFEKEKIHKPDFCMGGGGDDDDVDSEESNDYDVHSEILL